VANREVSSKWVQVVGEKEESKREKTRNTKNHNTKGKKLTKKCKVEERWST